MITAIVIPVDRDEPIRLEQHSERGLDAYRRSAVGNLQVLNLDRPPASLYVNKDARQMGMLANPRATALLWVHHSALRDQDVLVGPAFIVGPPDPHGDDTSAPQDLVDLLLHTTRYRLQVRFHGDPEWTDGGDQVFTDWFAAYVEGIQLARLWMPIAEVRVIPELADVLRETWYRLGSTSSAFSDATDSSLTRESFTGCYSVNELAKSISARSWPAGTAFYYRDLCFIQQDGGDDWWLVIKGDRIVFDGMELNPKIDDETFASTVRWLLNPSDEQQP